MSAHLISCCSKVAKAARVAHFARCALAALLSVAAMAHAGTMPNAGRAVSITAREQPIGAFLQDLFAAVDVPAEVAANLSGTVNGTFTGAADKVLRDVSRVYNLVGYYDGSVMHVVPASDLTRRSYTVAPAAADRLLRQAAEQGLPDTRNTLRRSGDGGLLAVGTRRFIEQFDDMVRTDQAPPVAAVPSNGGGADFRVFYLKYAWAQDMTMNFGGRQVVLPGVASILRSLVGAKSTGPLGSETLASSTQEKLRGQGLASQRNTSTNGNNNGNRNGVENTKPNGADMLVAALARTAQPEPAPTINVDPNQIRIEADQRLNAVIVRDQADRLPRYEQLIASLDVEPQSLEIEATIIDVDTTRMRELGINWRWNNTGDNRNVTGSFGSVLGAAATGGGVVSAVLGSAAQFVARISAMQSEGAARVVSSPQVVTLSDVEAVFDNSSTFYVRVAGRNDVDLFNVNAGTSLRVTPHVFRDKDNTSRIKLMVNVEDGNVTNQQVDKIPVVERSTINTQALITEGESLLIGGMVRDSTSSNVDKVPGLGDVPVVGNLFKTTTKGASRIERMFLITPRFAGTRAALPTSTPPAAIPAPRPASLQAAATPAAPAQPVAPAPSPVPAAPALAAAPAPAPTRVATAVPTATPAVAPQPAPAPIAAAAAPIVPASYTPPARASVVLDLDAPLPGSTLVGSSTPVKDR